MKINFKNTSNLIKWNENMSKRKKSIYFQNEFPALLSPKITFEIFCLLNMRERINNFMDN